jgi:hypothetical protein
MEQKYFTLKLLIYKSILKSVLTYGAQMWSIERKQRQIISYRNGLYKVFSKDITNGQN